MSAAIRAAGGACTDPLFVARFLSRAPSSSTPPTQDFCGEVDGEWSRIGCGESVRRENMREGGGPSSSELSAPCLDEVARLRSIRVCHRFDGDPFGLSESLREWPTWKSAARPPKTPRFFVGDSRRE